MQVSQHARGCGWAGWDPMPWMLTLTLSMAATLNVVIPQKQDLYHLSFDFSLYTIITVHILSFWGGLMTLCGTT